MANLSLTNYSPDCKYSSAHVEAEIGELTNQVKNSIDLMINCYDNHDYANAKIIFNSLSAKIKNTNTLSRLQDYL